MLLKRRIAGTAAGALCSFVVLAGSASATDWTGKDRVVGLGTNSATTIAAFILDAGSGPNGESPFGVGGFATASPDFKYIYNAGLIQCLRVSGNQATMVYTVKWRRGPLDLVRFSATRVYVQDNGKPDKWYKPPVDRVRNTLFDPVLNPQLLECPDPAAQATTDFINQAAPLTAGDTIVKDAT